MINRTSKGLSNISVGLDGGVDDVVFLPAPDFGNGSVIGAGSWQFGASGTCAHPEGVAAPLDFLEEVEKLPEDQLRLVMRENTAGLLRI